MRATACERNKSSRLCERHFAAGPTIFARIDHAANAAVVNMTLRPTQAIIFGAAKGGTPQMQEQQTSGINLPPKAPVWEDATGQTMLTCNDPTWIALRQGLANRALKL